MQILGHSPNWVKLGEKSKIMTEIVAITSLPVILLTATASPPLVLIKKTTSTK